MDKITILIVLLILSVIFIMIGHVYRKQIQLVMKQPICRIPSFELDWWSISHILLHFVCGLLFPHNHLSFLALGTGWEFLEDLLSSDATTKSVDCMNPVNKANNLMCRFSVNDGYWYGKFDDILMNFIGYELGSITVGFF